jgi:UrcA family protein
MDRKSLSSSFGFWLAGIGFGVSLCANVSFADNADNVLVQASSTAITVTPVARMSPVHQVSIAQRVSYRDINLSSATADVQLHDRIQAAAVDICQRLDERFPQSKPSGRACVSLAVKDALRKVAAKETVAQRKASN